MKGFLVLADDIVHLAQSVGCSATVISDLFESARGVEPDARLLKLPLTDQVAGALEAGISADEICQAIWGEGRTLDMVKASYGRPDAEIKGVWSGAGFEIVSTGGGCSAAMKTLAGVDFWVTDYLESDCPNPDYRVCVGAYVPNSGEWLNFTRDASCLAEVESHLAVWANELQPALQEALQADERPQRSSSTSAPRR